MKDYKSKLIGFIGGAAALCALCCTLPVLGIIGLGALEAYFCENVVLKWGGIILAGAAALYFLAKKYRSVASCATNCGCKPK